MWHLDEIFTDLTVVAIPTRTNFRGVKVREAISWPRRMERIRTIC